MTISDAIAEGTRRLNDAGLADGRRTASLLLGHLLDFDRARLITKSNAPLAEPQYEGYLGLIERCAAREPVQYITGHQEFFGLDFIVTPAVLIPRPETEFLVERVISLAGEAHNRSTSDSGFSGEAVTGYPVIVDVGTGSGCIAISVARSLPNSRVIGTDISSAALEVARLNADRNGVLDRVRFLEGDLLAPLTEAGLEGHVDLLACNPPYVVIGEQEHLQPQVRDWEPHLALFGGNDGLDFYRRLLHHAGQYIRKGGHMVWEIGFDQLPASQDLIELWGWELLAVTSDLQGIPRTLTIGKGPGA